MVEDLSKFDAVNFILDGEICNHTNAQKKQTKIL